MCLVKEKMRLVNGKYFFSKNIFRLLNAIEKPFTKKNITIIKINYK